ncbi:hypothetical protein MA16_Dca028977 [Dendrobium catenatum]|uniref:Uncharacterized protein n=1 Tax=Dendrobium catenatum TaxID=906689 RepID=A0A2I0VDL4_9ASPA|nr:hypothetical protein MA16_Dca028977 [Dendrobium catenatum]
MNRPFNSQNSSKVAVRRSAKPSFVTLLPKEVNGTASNEEVKIIFNLRMRKRGINPVKQLKNIRP